MFDDAVAPSDDWGSGGDDFGDFNDAAEGADDDGFGAFNEAGQQSTAETTVSSPVADTQQQQQQQPSNQQQQEAKSVAGIGIIWRVHSSCSISSTLHVLSRGCCLHLPAQLPDASCSALIPSFKVTT